MGRIYTLLIFSTRKLPQIDKDASFEANHQKSIESILALLERGQFPDAIILGAEVLSQGFPEIKQIHERLLLAHAMQDQVTIKPPIIVVTKNDYEQQLTVLNAGATEALPFDLPPDFFCGKIKSIIERFDTEQTILTSYSNQHKKTIETLVQLNKKTGVYDKTTFIAKSRELMRANPEHHYIIVLLDLDKFKVFNEMFGFDEGDKVLEKGGNFFRTVISKKSRYGHIYADRFVMLIDEEVFSLTELRRMTVECASQLHPNFDFIMRFGLYRMEDDNLNLGIDRAELALRSIKQDFTTRFAWYDESMIHNLIEEQELISDMVTGIKNREFTVYLQPQFDYTTDTLIGAEALVRWIHPTKGLISPGVFIPVFERNGFITQLDHFVWEETCRLLHEWIEQGLNPVPVSVNISRRDIYDPNLVHIFDHLLEKYELTPRLLRLEITESAYMDNPSQLIQVVEELRSHGFCLEMDDFGSGYSSLNTLKEVPVDILKLDMKFIASATSETEEESQAATKGGSILSSVVRMANYLHLPVIAEGIESKDQADYLKSIGCFHMQGFYFAKPMPVQNYVNLLSELPVIYNNESTTEDLNNATAFLNAKTQSTLLFNSFVGGAAIIEWIGQNVEAMRMNDQFFEELGITREEYEPYRINILNQLEEPSKKLFLQTLADVTRTKKTAFCEIRCKPIHKGSKPFWLRAHLHHLGKTITSNIYYLSIDNIDFRMQLLQLNENLSEQLSTIMESVPCGILTMNYGADVSLTYSNETAFKLLGYSQNEFRKATKNSPLDIFNKEEKKALISLIENAIKHKERNFSTNSVLVCKDSSKKPVQTSGNILQRSDGTVLVNLMFMES